MSDGRIYEQQLSESPSLSNHHNLVNFAKPDVLVLNTRQDSILQTESALESTATKVAREALVLSGGVGKGFFYGLAGLPSRWPEVGSSVAIGAGLSAISKTGRLGAVVSTVIGASFLSRFLLDTVNDTERWKKFGGAVSDTWKSGDHISDNINTVHKTVGTLAFDTSLSVASGYIGYTNKALGDLILGVLRIPPVVPAPPPILSPFLTRVNLIGSITPSGAFYSNYNDRPGNAEKTNCLSSTWKIDLNATLRREINGCTGGTTR